jgi:hypothetical protein
VRSRAAAPSDASRSDALSATATRSPREVPSAAHRTATAKPRRTTDATVARPVPVEADHTQPNIPGRSLSQQAERVVELSHASGEDVRACQARARVNGLTRRFALIRRGV